MNLVPNLILPAGRAVWPWAMAPIVIVLLATGLGVAAKKAPANDDGGKPAEAKTEDDKPAKSSKFKPFREATKDAEKISGLIDLYRDGDHLYAALKPSDLGEMFIAPISIARGLGAAGTAFNFDEQWVISFQRVGDKVQVVRKNLHYEAPEGSELEKAIRQNYMDSVLMALPIVSDDAPHDAVLVDLADIFFTNFANLPVGNLDRQRASWEEVQGFPENIELEVNVTYADSPNASGMGSNNDVGFVDRRGLSVVLHYSLVKMPAAGYEPRLADPRLGFFVSATKNYGSENPDTIFARRINRWRLEKSGPKARLSPPKRQIVWWIEDTVPIAYRPYVEAGILEWNKAFEKIGFQNAMAVRWQTDHDTFDPEDIHYCTFRWVTVPFGIAMSNVRSNPLTGEMIDGDVIFDASWIRYWDREHAYLLGSGATDDPEKGVVLDVGEIISPMMAAQYGFGLPTSLRRRLHNVWPESPMQNGRTREVVPGNWNPIQAAINRQISTTSCGAACQYASSMQGQFRLAAAIADRAIASGSAWPQLPEKMIGQLIKGVVMHEVGHSLGLRHNFRASAMLDADEMHDTKVTHKHGLVGSVMDYMPINLARRGEPQGDYATTTLGPYDYWAIEYAYRQFDGDEATQLKKIAARSPTPGLEFATDEDYYCAYDPLVNQYDLGSDALQFARRRLGLAHDVIQNAETSLVADGESWARLRPAVLTALQQYGDASYLAMRYVGGRNFSRDARGGEGAREPIAPISGPKQRDALKFLAETVLVDKPVDVPPRLLRRMTTEHWSHWGVDADVYEGKIGAPFYAYVASIQNVALAEAFGSGLRFRLIESNEALADEQDDPLRAADVFRTFTDAVWSDLQRADEGGSKELKLSKVRRNLQRLHLRYLAGIVLWPKESGGASAAYAMFTGMGDPFPAEARSLARQHLKEIRDLVASVLSRDALVIDDISRTHLADLSDQLTKVLDAQVTAGDF